MFVGLVKQAEGTQTRASSWPQARLQEWSWYLKLFVALIFAFFAEDFCDTWKVWRLLQQGQEWEADLPETSSLRFISALLSLQSEEKCHEVTEDLVAASFENNRNLVTAPFERVQFWLSTKYIVNLLQEKDWKPEKWPLSFNFIETLRSCSRAICPDQLTQIPGNQPWPENKKLETSCWKLPNKIRNSKKIRKSAPLFTEDKRIRKKTNGTSCWCSMALTKRRGQRIDLEQVSRGQLLTNTTLLDYRGQLLTCPKFSTISWCWSKNNLSTIWTSV